MRQLAASRTVPSSIHNWPGYLYVFTLILLGSCITVSVRQTQLQYVFLRQCHCNLLGLSGIHFVFYLRVSIWGHKIIDSTIDSTISRYSGQSYIMCFSANRKIAARYHLPFYLGWCFHNRKVWKQRAQWNRQSSAVCALKYMLLLQTYSIRSSISTSTPQVSDNLTHQPMPLTTHTCHLDPLQISNLNSQGVLSVFKCNNRLGLCAPYWMLNACESP